jgi:hypothetical protein
MTDLLKARPSQRCTSCGKYRSVETDFTAVRVGDDPENPVCDGCKAGTSAKATDPASVQKRLAAKSDQIWAGVAKAANAWKRDLDLRQMGREWADRMWAEMLRKQQQERIAAALTKAKKYEQAADQSYREIRASERQMEATQRQRDALNAWIEDVNNEAAARVTEITKRIDAMTARLDAAQHQVQMNAARQAATKARREAENAESWIFKAGTVQNDPELRLAYLARAEGKDFDDDDD